MENVEVDHGTATLEDHYAVAVRMGTAALDFIRCGLPNHDPYRAWANFEFQTPDGAIYEIDLLVLTKHGFWLGRDQELAGTCGG